MKAALIHAGRRQDSEGVWKIIARAAAELGGLRCFVWRPEAPESEGGSQVREEESGYGAGTDRAFARLSFGRIGKEELTACTRPVLEGKALCLEGSLLEPLTGAYASQMYAKKLLEAADDSFDLCLTDTSEEGAAWQAAADEADVIFLCMPAGEEGFRLIYERYRLLREKLIFVFLLRHPEEEERVRRLIRRHQLPIARCILLRKEPGREAGFSEKEAYGLQRDSRELYPVWRVLARRLTEAGKARKEERQDSLRLKAAGDSAAV